MTTHCCSVALLGGDKPPTQPHRQQQQHHHHYQEEEEEEGKETATTRTTGGGAGGSRGRVAVTEENLPKLKSVVIMQDEGIIYCPVAKVKPDAPELAIFVCD